MSLEKDWNSWKIVLDKVLNNKFKNLYEPCVTLQVEWLLM